MHRYRSSRHDEFRSRSDSPGPEYESQSTSVFYALYPSACSCFSTAPESSVEAPRSSSVGVYVSVSVPPVSTGPFKSSNVPSWFVGPYPVFPERAPEIGGNDDPFGIDLFPNNSSTSLRTQRKTLRYGAHELSRSPVSVR